MRKLLISLLIVVVISACSQEKPEQKDTYVLVKGGAFINTNSNYKSTTISNFYIGQYEVTQKEWVEIMGSNPSAFKGDKLPVEMVNWYDVIDYCNKRSIKRGVQTLLQYR